MQNKGFVKFIAVLLTLICCFYFSFSFVTNKYKKEAEKIEATKGKEAARQYLDQKRGEKVFLGWKTLADCEKLQIGLGLDLKGGVSFLLEVSVPDMIATYAGSTANDADFQKLVAEAKAEASRTGSNFVDVFVAHYNKAHGENQLGAVFAEKMSGDGIDFKSTDADVKKALEEKISGAVDNAYEVIRSRIDQYGVAQPNIQILRGKGQLGQIMVEMPGVTDPEDVKDLLTGSANLEFWTTCDAAEVQSEMAELANLPIHVEQPKKGKATEMEVVEKTIGQVLSTQYAGGCVVGAVASKAEVVAIEKALQTPEAAELVKNFRLAFSAKPEAGTNYTLYALKGERGDNGQLIPSLSGDVIADAKPDFDTQHNGRPIVSMTMKSDAARIWADVTGRNVGKPIAIVLDGRVYSAPAPSERIGGGSSQISGNFTPDATRSLAIVLKSGKMSVPLVAVQTETVGPSLGEASIKAGFQACIIAFVLLMVFMCLFYGFKGGMVANVALLLNLFFTFGILTSFQAALTMSGIAGLVLSLGMAVDANVLIYERIKEELRAGKNIKQAVADGYGNAFSAIFDSNLTSIITAVILYNFGTGPIRGFALTLGIGICASFFTAVWLTRIVYEHFVNNGKWQKLTFTTGLSRKLFKTTNIAFMTMGKKSIIVFSVLAVVFVGIIFGNGLARGIDFTGGRNYVIQFENNITPDEAKVAKAVAAAVKDSDDPNASVSALKVVTAESVCIRVSTNYHINGDDEEVDRFVYDALHKAKLITADYTTFKDRENRAGGSIVSSQKVDSSVADDMTKGAFWAVIFSLIAIFFYILVRFRNMAFSVGSITALVFDTLFIIGMYALCWRFVPFSLEIDQTFIGAVLTAIGYSINDKVVVFDRIRENIGLYPKRATERLFNESLNSTLTRTLMTSLTTLLVLLCIFFLGGDSVRSFAFAMILGVIFGTLSSIFLAAPVALRVFGKKRIREEVSK
ncbi:MAG: protein translocase subunit SecD [Prevotellamassilia sp.]|nr:protein translocase subunit SecD [Prevotellamassilia sp.]MCI6144133.1 protein translocase subunit SecD [Bacteroidales bacterium]MDY2624472.1 protein translocase subunit SecD [Alloprevotella sp.]MDD7563373.1 protein translocase subunit SecD [Prevotellamassilia sp.]MDY5761655.1 protein translocase subunit SecD [Alloprevotella sp.]